MNHDRSEFQQPLWRAVVRQELGAVRQREAPVTGSKTSRSSRRSSAGPAMGLMLGARGRWVRGWDGIWMIIIVTVATDVKSL